eukprot:CAMPEP_0113573932 /NCGR_PEP_ID=MMETSP0015_2-20120614/26880_1 /TAXON_ID=2838 /ORGANISM="Odontella" /LENGTH=241 /DNA_ID=CAMNT_0000477041 /DNA_START=32 /DNA_END=753 /DNA_ORIENTATION=- /assembly_acc=CAM_ASM_000160
MMGNTTRTGGNVDAADRKVRLAPHHPSSLKRRSDSMQLPSRNGVVPLAATAGKKSASSFARRGGIGAAVADADPSVQRHGSLPSVWQKEGEMSLTKLRFESVGTHGRNDEASQIRDSWRRRVSAMRATRGRDWSRSDSKRSLGDGNSNDNGNDNGNDGGSPELVLLAGHSGSGKSHLAVSALKDPVRRSGGLFLRRKFDMRIQEPYEAFLDAFEELCDVVARRGRTSDKFLRVQSAVRESL